MNQEEFEFLLFDRIEKIKQINEQYDLENNAYISFSGGKDSTILHYLIDMALPNNKIPRIYINTGIEYNDIVKYVKELANKDDRIILINSGVNIKQMLEKVGYPFKSKDFAQKVSRFNRIGKTKSIKRFLEFDGILACPNKLKYLFENKNATKFIISDKCCENLKENVLIETAKKINRNIAVIGLTGDEKGRRNQYHKNCWIDYKIKKMFYPMRILNNDFINMFIDKYNIKLCKLYYPPFNLIQTGCKGCPFTLHLQKQLDMMRELLPNEYKQCESIWKPVYDEYRRIGYRLRKKGESKQTSIFDFLEVEE